MATDGDTGEELYSFELFECSVCFESLINKQPRLLSCGHTFCTPCLQQMSEGNTVLNVDHLHRFHCGAYKFYQRY